MAGVILCNNWTLFTTYRNIINLHTGWTNSSSLYNSAVLIVLTISGVSFIRDIFTFSNLKMYFDVCAIYKYAKVVFSCMKVIHVSMNTYYVWLRSRQGNISTFVPAKKTIYPTRSFELRDIETCHVSEACLQTFFSEFLPYPRCSMYGIFTYKTG